MARVAVIEDDPAIGPMLDRILRMEGFQVTVVNDGAAALPALRAGGYNAAILDVMLPGKDGLTILREIRETAETELLPVVMLTAKKDDETTWQGWKAGASYFLSKPFDPEELIRILRSVLI
jgi:DNA-binding response OmpR family regulator